MLKYFFYLILFSPLTFFSQQVGNISGSIIDSLNREPMFGVNIALENTKYGTNSGLDGNFQLENIPVGIYDITVSYIGYKRIQLKNVIVKENESTNINFELSQQKILWTKVDSSAVFFRFYIDDKIILENEGLLIEYFDSLYNYTIRGSDFTKSKQMSIPHTTEFEIDTSDSGTISFTLTIVDEVAAQGKFQLPLKNDWVWNVDLFITDRNPTQTCWGCSGYKAFEIIPKYRKSINDSLYFVWGGRPISYIIQY